MSTTPPDPQPLQFGEVRTVGVSISIEADGIQRVRVERIEVRDAALQAPFGSLKAASATLADVTALLRPTPADGGPLDRLAGFTIGELRLVGATFAPRGGGLRRAAPPAARARRNWRLEPLGALDGSLHADIVDAAWVFDVKVTVPISRGRLDFNRVTVEHVGPDSSMGISRMGVYVDAPNGRTYVYQLATPHVPGATFERRGKLLPWSSGDRGAIDLQPLLEGRLAGAPFGAVASDARDMLARTRVSGEVRLGDGVIGDDRSRVVLTGREQGRNHVQLAWAPAGAGILLRLPELEAREARLELRRGLLTTGTLSGTLSVQIEASGAAPSMSVNVVEMTLRDIAYRIGDDEEPGRQETGASSR